MGQLFSSTELDTSTSTLITPITPSTRPLRVLEGSATTVAVFPDKRRIVTASHDKKTLHLWDLKTGVVLKGMEGHSNKVEVLAVSRDGQIIASGDENGEIIAWHGETGEPLTQPIKAHSSRITSLDFSPDGTVLATGSWDTMTKFWRTETWQMQGDPIQCHATIHCVRYSPRAISNPFGRRPPRPLEPPLEPPPPQHKVAIATSTNIEIYNSGTRERVESFEAHSSSLAWVSDRRLLSGGNHAIAINPTGTFVASTSDDNHVRLWRLSDRQTIAIFQHSSIPTCVTFSVDGKHILIGGQDKISEWAVPKFIHPKILAISTARDACVTGDLSTAETLITQDIHTDANDYTSYANRSFIMARKHAWDRALEDAIKSISIQPSLTGYISKGIALCGKGHIREARTAFHVASMFTNQDSATNHFLLLTEAIALFNADQHDEAMLLIKELAAACPNADALGCCVVEAYLRIQLGTKALGDARYNEAADHFTTTVNAGAFSSQDTHLIYEDLTALFGWDLGPVRFNANYLKSLLLTTHQKRCQAFLSAGKLDEALEAYQNMKDAIGENTTANCLDWSNAFKQECSVLCAVNGDTALTASDYDRAIVLYSAAINLNFVSDAIFANRCKAKLSKMLWMEALLDAQKVIELDPLSYLGYNLKHASLHGAQHYDEAIQTFQTMFSKLDDAPDVQTRELCQQHLRPSEVECAIRRVIDAQLDNAPLRVLNITTGLLCDREAQISTFKMSMEYKELVSSTITHTNLPMKHIEEVVMTYLQYAMLSHRWEREEPLLQDIQGKNVYDSELDPVGGMMKLRSFCKTAHDAGYNWAWSDTCCIDKSNDVELQESVNSMFIWYNHSALTIVYLSDVPPSSTSGALAKSAWNTRGWTIQEFIAPKVILFYQNNWTLYLDDRTQNHKESITIMQELQGTTGIDRLAVAAFRPSLNGAREKLHWASTRVTTHQEDIAYSLFGIFGVRLSVDYGEKQEKALGRLLQEIVARSGDITSLDWVGKSSEFNSCLPASITSYEAPPCKLPLLPEDKIRSSVSSLRKTVAMDFASNLYTLLQNMSPPRFAAQRLHLPCIAFNVREVRRVHGPPPETLFTYGVKADGLRDLLITTEETLVQFWPVRPTEQKFVLVLPWDSSLLALPDFVEPSEFVEPSDFGIDLEGEEEYVTPPSSPSDDWSSGSPVQQEVVDIESRALRLLVRLGQPFSAFLLAQQRSGEYKRIASDRDIIGQVNDVVSVGDLMDIRTIEIS